MESNGKSAGIAMIYRLCPVCCKPVDDETSIVLDTKLKDKKDSIERYHNSAAGFASKLCPSCLTQAGADGIWIVEADITKTDDMQNPWRTGRQWCITESLLRRIVIDPELVDNIIKNRMSYMPIDVANAIFGEHFDGDGDAD